MADIATECARREESAQAGPFERGGEVGRGVRHESDRDSPAAKRREGFPSGRHRLHHRVATLAVDDGGLPERFRGDMAADRRSHRLQLIFDRARSTPDPVFVVAAPHTVAVVRVETDNRADSLEAFLVTPHRERDDHGAEQVEEHALETTLRNRHGVHDTVRSAGRPMMAPTLSRPKRSTSSSSRQENSD